MRDAIEERGTSPEGTGACVMRLGLGACHTGQDVRDARWSVVRAICVLIALLVASAAFLFVQRTAYADDAGGEIPPLQSYTAVTDIYGNPLSGEVSLELIQQGIVIKRFWLAGAPTGIQVNVYSSTGERMEGKFTEKAPFDGYSHSTLINLRTLQPNTTYTIVLQQCDSWGVIPGTSAWKINFTTGAGSGGTGTGGGLGNSPDGEDGGDTEGGTGETPTGGTGSDETNNTSTSSERDISRSGSTNAQTVSTVQPESELSPAPNLVVEPKPVVLPQATLAQGGFSRLAVAAGSGNLFQVGSSPRSLVQDGDSPSGGGSALNLAITGLPWLWLVFIIVLITALPGGLARRLSYYQPKKREGRLMEQELQVASSSQNFTRQSEPANW